ncbi:hypothetical protein [uncultured Massilia sp.]|uniref:hypothetical protein n=1 Tax=uncultured Massilia sp. TaxID=169973 RepID=UPI0025F1FC3E|nr:hypothetical protein [uncultured Massilia sp.]
MTRGPDIDWFLALEDCPDLDAIRARWQPLLERHQMAPHQPEPGYRDAMLSFLGRCALPAPLRLAAVLALGSAFDVDLRLALGALGAQALDDAHPWPDAVADAVAPTGPPLALAPGAAGSDGWLAAFAAGRLAGLRETLVHDGDDLPAWRRRFWQAFLEMACRHGHADAVRLALRHGADPCADDWRAVGAAAGGARRHEDCAPGRGDADYLQVLALLLDAGARRGAMLAAALDAAAAAGNTAILGFLLERGADLRAGGARALAQAARHLAWDAFDWLHAHGADARTADGSVLAAAAASLDETMLDMALAAGADPVDGALAAWRAALQTQPWDLYGAETDFTGWRAAIVAQLLRHGARPAGQEAAALLRAARDGRRVVDALARRRDLGAGCMAVVAALARQAFGAGYDDASAT